MQRDWQITKHGERCANCEHVFESGESFQAVLLATATAEYERRDYCENCPPPAEAGVIGVWRAHRPPPVAPRRQAFDREAILGFFQRLEDEEAADKAQFRFVLGLLLWRKKVLKLEQTWRDGETERWRFSLPSDGTTHETVNPDLDEIQIERLSEQVERLLSAGVAPSEAEPAAGPEGAHDQA